jgi:hypothetical protein
MKRISAILLVIGIYNIADAQIQRRFWGLELHACYKTIQLAKNQITESHNSVEISNNNQIFVYGGEFGGLYWDLASFGFYNNKINDSYDLAEVSFLIVRENYGSAEVIYNALSHRLKNKYGAPVYESKNSDSASFNWEDSEKYICSLLIDKSCDQKWIVALIYTCWELKYLCQKQIEEEI